MGWIGWEAGNPNSGGLTTHGDVLARKRGKINAHKQRIREKQRVQKMSGRAKNKGKK
jgi:hypothetical protein